MLLFSTILEMNKTMTKDDFIKLVIEWNQGSPHPANVIPNIVWNGERNIRYGNESVWMDIQEYRNKNIIAVRFEKKEEDGVVWDTDYTMNFDTMKMAIRLDRSYLEEALTVDSKFSTPHFITLLIERGYIKKDGELAVLRNPIFIDDDNLQLLVDVINGKSKYRLPVVYISKTLYDKDPVDVARLAGRLKGAAHVLVQKSNGSNMRLREQCSDKNEYYGAIGIYYPNQAVGHRRYLYRSSDGIDRILSERVIREVIQYGNRQMVDRLYTWAGVNNALLQDRLISQKEERATAENERKLALYELLSLKADLDQKQESMKLQALEAAKTEADKILDGFEDDMQKLREEVSRLSNEVERLEYENQGLRRKLDANTSVPVLFMGEEDDLYQGEIKDLVLSTLIKGMEGVEPKTRRHDVLGDIIQSNDYQGTSEKRAEEIKRLLSNYSGMTPKLKHGLEAIGFLFDESDHQKVKYYGDDRYTVVYASTPSDKGRGGKNNVRTTVKKVF
jgi:hypothetical protein